tara:strand:+ start:426 stop:1625 length:1200 start_codon:yes stop_codon:yes gene_type:complete
MALLGNMSMGRGMSQITPEERMLKNERKRVSSFIRQYNANPDDWSKPMLDSLERLALQYQIPFKRQVPAASVARNIGAGVGGAIDSALFDFMPDKWYSSEATRKAANWGKGVGTALQIGAALAATPFTGGASLAAAGKGAGALAKLARGAQASANVVSKGLPGQAMKFGLQQGAKAVAPYGQAQGWKWLSKKGMKEFLSGNKAASAQIVKQAKGIISGKSTGSVDELLKGVKVSKNDANKLIAEINKSHSKAKGKGLTKTGQELINQVNASIGSTTTMNIKAGVLRGIANVAPDNVTIAAKSVKDLSAWLVKKFKLPVKDATKLAEVLKEQKFKNFKEARQFLVSGGGEAAQLGTEVNKVGLGLGALGVGGAASQLVTGRTPSREELEQSQDPYDPYNV